MNYSSVLEVFKVPCFVALHLVEVKLIVRVHLGDVRKVPCAQLVNQRFRCGSGIQESLLIEVPLWRILQDAVSHLLCL